MTRLDGEKKSPLPWIIGLLVLALLAAAIYYFTVNKSTEPAAADGNGVGIGSPRGGFAEDNGTDTNMADMNAADANAMDSNAMDSNMMDTNALLSNSAMMDSNAMDTNSAMNSGTMMDNSAMDAPIAGATPASMSNNSPAGNDTIATRSKTIKTDDKTVIYKKSVKEDGALMRDKVIVPEPVQKAKSMQ